MNLSEALEAALPEIPRHRNSRDKPPRVDPELIIREDVSDGEPIIAVYQRSTANLLRMKPTQWQLARLFDGVRSYEEIAGAFANETGIPLSADEARTFAENMDEGGFWFKSPQEKNIAMTEKLAAQRSRKAKGLSSINLAHIQFSAWDPDHYLTVLDRKIGKYVYNRWMVLFAVLLFVSEAVIFIAKWKVIGPDIPVYYDFSQKSISDLAQFWVMLLVVGFIHESSHGLTCKHYGGEVHSMGLMFLYLTPAFYVDVTESWVTASRLQRMATIIAGIWVEMLVCAVAVLVWINTQPGEWLHDICYKLILLTGIAVVVINLNPLIKLDGYYFLTEWLRVPDLKERSTAFLSGWVQRYVFRMPVDVPVVAQRRVPLFVFYAIASGAYSYMLIWVFVVFSYNVMATWMAGLALIPAAVLAFFLFESRLHALGRFVRSIYRVSSEEGAFRLTPLRILACIAVLVLLFAPLLRERLDAYFVIESQESRDVRAGAAGKVVGVYVKEGDRVRAGQVVAKLERLDDETMPAIAGELTVSAPMAGVVTTRDPETLTQQDVVAGDALLRIINPEKLVARLYVPATEMDRVRAGDGVSLEMPSNFSAIKGRLGVLDEAAVVVPPGVLPVQQFKGDAVPTFYAGRVSVGEGDSGLAPGVSGEAKIFGRRMSLAERVVRRADDVVRSIFW